MMEQMQKHDVHHLRRYRAHFGWVLRRNSQFSKSDSVLPLAQFDGLRRLRNRSGREGDHKRRSFGCWVVVTRREV